MKRTLLILFILLCPVFVFAVSTVDINTASLQQLDTLTGIGPVKAQAIIDARPFSSVDDLSRVKGIGPKTLQKIKDQGLAYVSGNSNNQIPNPNPAPTPMPTNATPAPQTTPTAPTGATNEQTNTTPAIIYPSGVTINEILPNPEGPDETDEWIELYNSNNSDVDLSGWQLQDKEGTITIFTVPQNTKIPANGFLVFKRPDTKIMLNNDQDGLDLSTPDTKIIDSVDFASAPLNQSYNKTDGAPFGSWQWSLTLTPGTKNIITALAAKTSVKPLSTAKNSVKNTNVNVATADIIQNTNINQENSASQKGDTTNPWFLFFTVLATTIILAAIVLFIKLKLARLNNPPKAD